MSSENARFDGQSIDGGMGDFEGSTFLDAAQDRQHVASSIDDCFGQEEILSFVSEIENAPVVEAREFYHDAELNFPGRVSEIFLLESFFNVLYCLRCKMHLRWIRSTTLELVVAKIWIKPRVRLELRTFLPVVQSLPNTVMVMKNFWRCSRQERRTLRQPN